MSETYSAFKDSSVSFNDALWYCLNKNWNPTVCVYRSNYNSGVTTYDINLIKNGNTFSKVMEYYIPNFVEKFNYATKRLIDEIGFNHNSLHPINDIDVRLSEYWTKIFDNKINKYEADHRCNIKGYVYNYIVSGEWKELMFFPSYPNGVHSYSKMCEALDIKVDINEQPTYETKAALWYYIRKNFKPRVFINSLDYGLNISLFENARTCIELFSEFIPNFYDNYKSAKKNFLKEVNINLNDPYKIWRNELGYMQEYIDDQVKAYGKERGAISIFRHLFANMLYGDWVVTDDFFKEESAEKEFKTLMTKYNLAVEDEKYDTSKTMNGDLTVNGNTATFKASNGVIYNMIISEVNYDA